MDGRKPLRGQLLFATFCYMARRGGPRARVGHAKADEQRQLNVRIDPNFYQAIETMARRERRSVAETARLLLEDGLRSRARAGAPIDATLGSEGAPLAGAAGA